MFTKAEAVNLLQNSWKVKNVEKRFSSDRKKFLGDIIVLIHEKVPFHMFIIHELACTPPEKRVIPSLEEIDKLGVAGIGGNCTFLNLFTKSLLRGLGYSVYLCRATTFTTIFNPHLAVIVKDLEKKGDLHLVDCGSGYPSFRPVSLNFDNESPVYRDSFLEYKFVRHEGKILRLHGQGDLTKSNQPSIHGLDLFFGKWRRFLELTLETIDCHTLEDLGPLLSMRYLPRNLLPRAVRFPGRRAVLIFADQLLLEQDDGTLQRTTMESDEEILESYRKYFPTLSEARVRLMYASWRRRTKLSKL